jgi:hypothetical protein
MAEMLIQHPESTYIALEYDFIFVSGMVLPLTLIPTKGDTINFVDDMIVIRITAKPSMNDPTRFLPSEDITIFKRHLLSMNKREYERPDLTPEQAVEWQKTVQELSTRTTH